MNGFLKDIKQEYRLETRNFPKGVKDALATLEWIFKVGYNIFYFKLIKKPLCN